MRTRRVLKIYLAPVHNAVCEQTSANSDQKEFMSDYTKKYSRLHDAPLGPLLQKYYRCDICAECSGETFEIYDFTVQCIDRFLGSRKLTGKCRNLEITVKYAPKVINLTAVKFILKLTPNEYSQVIQT